MSACTECGHHRFPGEPRCENCKRLKREATTRTDTGAQLGSIFYTPGNDIDRRRHKPRLKENGY